MTELLLLRTSPGPDRTGVLVIGPLDHRTAHQFREQMSRLIAAEDTRPVLVIDLTCCTHADDHGIQALAEARAAAQAAGKEVRVDGVPPLIADRMRNQRRTAGSHPTTGA